MAQKVLKGLRVPRAKHLSACSVKEGTLRMYKGAVDMFLEWARDKCFDVSTLSKVDGAMVEFFTSLFEDAHAPSTGRNVLFGDLLLVAVSTRPRRDLLPKCSRGTGRLAETDSSLPAGARARGGHPRHSR